MKLTDSGFVLAATDLSNYLACGHLTELSRKVALGELTKPMWHDPALAVLEKRGLEHEQAYVDHLRGKGLTVADLKGRSMAATREAMQAGADVLVQARLEDGPWMGL